MRVRITLESDPGRYWFGKHYSAALVIYRERVLCEGRRGSKLCYQKIESSFVAHRRIYASDFESFYCRLKKIRNSAQFAGCKFYFNWNR